MKIGLHDSDNKNFPNLALMKISAFHKKQGDQTSLFLPIEKYDKIYSSKVFTFTEKDHFLPHDSINGGTGYKLSAKLPDHIEHLCPDYSLYKTDYSIGFLTRGCIRNCSFCIVPEKEGKIKPHADIEEFTKHKKVILLDNNILAHDHGIKQIEKISSLALKVDFNQGMDARLVDKQIAKRLSKVKWIRFLRFACDNKTMIPHIKKTVELLGKQGVKPYRIFCYFLVKDINEALDRIEVLREIGVDIFAMPYRDFESKKEPKKIIKQFARWVNHKATFKSVKWKDYGKTQNSNQDFAF